MRKSVWIFLLAVLGPSAVLGWLALRSAEEQKIILERQTAELYQRETETLSAAVRGLIDEQRRSFGEVVQGFLKEEPAPSVARDFATRLVKTWPRKAVGFSLDSEGRLISPGTQEVAACTSIPEVVRDHGGFLWGNTSAAVYNVSVDDLTQPELLRKNKGLADNRVGASSQLNGRDAWRARVLNAEPTADNEKAAATKDFKLAEAEVSSDEKDKLASQEQMMRGGKGSPAKENAAMAGAISKTEKSAAVAAAPKPAAAPASAARQAKPGGDAPGSGPSLALAKKKDLSAYADRAESAPAPPASIAPAAPLALDEKPAPAKSLRLEGTMDLGNFKRPDAPAEEKSKTAPVVTLDSIARPQDQNALVTNTRVVQPQQMLGNDSDQRAVLSTLAPSTAEFRTLYEGQSEGVLTRFVQNKLTLVFWVRPVQASGALFGCVLDAADLGDLWPPIMGTLQGYQQRGRLESTMTRRGGPEFILALLDDRGRPVATAPAGTTGRDWKRPFVASEVGEALPHWETALYLQRPEQIQESALGLRRTLGFFIVALLGAIAVGCWLVVADTRRQLALAQQKTDFVSNVSHELKTPLTSIRMFAELMLGGRAETQAKAPQYLRIIMVEAERLTRLINNVLDFAKIERRQKRFDKKPLELHEVVARVWEGHELHLRESGFTTHWEAAPPPYSVVGDEDALAQVLVNLLSNAEKYSAERKEIELHTYLDGRFICLSVLDRGLGIPAGSERKIFEPFYRAHDSLSSGIQGSGLGLTLAQRLAHEHGGEIEYRAREGGGSAFTLKIPVQREDPSEGRTA